MADLQRGQSASATGRPLTAKQRAVLDLFPRYEELMNEGVIVDDLYPLIPNPRSARMVVNSLEKRGLIVKGEWWEESGFSLCLTRDGYELVVALGV